jgi:hypothetical protein
MVRIIRISGGKLDFAEEAQNSLEGIKTQAAIHIASYDVYTVSKTFDHAVSCLRSQQGFDMVIESELLVCSHRPVCGNGNLSTRTYFNANPEYSSDPKDYRCPGII